MQAAKTEREGHRTQETPTRVHYRPTNNIDLEMLVRALKEVEYEDEEEQLFPTKPPMTILQASRELSEYRNRASSRILRDSYQ